MTARLTPGQRALATAAAVLGAALCPLAFTVMFLVVRSLLAADMDGWAWTVPLGTELGFTGLFLWDLLLEWRRRPKRALRLMPYLFAALSLALNVYAGGCNVPATIGHAVLPLVFFGYLIAGEHGIRAMAVSDEDRARVVALADARAHARDVLRAGAGPFWRLRTPVLLRRQLRSGRLPASVLTAIEQGLAFGGASRWEPVVEKWLTDSLTFPERFTAQLGAAREAASQPAITTPSGTAPETSAPEAAPPPLETPAAAPSRKPAKRPPGRPSKPQPRRMSDKDLVPYIHDLPGGAAAASISAVMTATGTGRERARTLLELARDEERRERMAVVR